MKKFDENEAAKVAIATSPDITAGEEVLAAGKKAKPGKKAANLPAAVPAESDLEADDLEVAAGRVVAKAFDRIRTDYGADPDADVTTLLSETMTGLFTLARSFTAAPWVRYLVAGGAVCVWLLPPFLKFNAAKNAVEEEAKK